MKNNLMRYSYGTIVNWSVSYMENSSNLSNFKGFLIFHPSNAYRQAQGKNTAHGKVFITLETHPTRQM